MLNLFNDLSADNKGLIRYPEWDFIRSGLMMNLNNTRQYYRSGAYATGSDHPLVKLLFGLYTSVDTDLASYYRRVDDKALTVAQQVGFTTVASKGHLFNNVFFAGQSKEVIIVTDEEFDPELVAVNWEDAVPIRILRHGFDTIDCFPLTGKVQSSAVSVFCVNLPMLAVQYRSYRLTQMHYQNENPDRNSIYHFLYSYPINNMIYDAMDHSVFNRLVKLSQGLPTSDNQYRHPFHVTNYTGRCDRILSKVLTSLSENNKDLGTIAKTIPMVCQDSLFELMKLPDIIETRQINWAIYLARIDMLLFLLSYDCLKNMNQSFLSKLKFDLGLYLRDGTIQSAVPHELFEKQKLVIEQILSKLP